MIVEIIWNFLLVPLLVVFLILVYKYIDHVINLKKYPRGPFPLPLIGNLHQLGTMPYKGMQDLAKKYGPVYSVSFGSNRVVVVNAIEQAKEALVKSGADFAGRPKNYAFGLLSRNYKTISLSEYGPFYTTIKKIGHSALKAFGEGTTRIEKITVEESQDLHRRLLKTEGEPADVSYKFGLSVLNIIAELTFGRRYSEDDKDFQEIVDFTGLVFAGLGACDVVAVFPWLRYFPLEGITMLKQGLAIRDRFFRQQLLEHKRTFDPDNIRDITDSVIKVLQEERTLEKAGVSFFTDDNIEMIMSDMFVGGSEPATSTLRWMIVYLLHWPQYQDEIYKEIKEVCGDERYPTYEDRHNLNLTYAMILETMRYSSLAPLGFPRKAIKDTILDGQSIPKDTEVLFNFWAIHHDERYWENPNEFNPRRFLDEEGKYVVLANESFIPFGAGKRQCFGEVMVKMEIFVLFARLMRDFTVEKVPGEPLPSLQGKLGVSLAPEPFKAVFNARNNNLAA